MSINVIMLIIKIIVLFFILNYNKTLTGVFIFIKFSYWRNSLIYIYSFISPPFVNLVNLYL